MEAMLEAQILERRLFIWNKIQELYFIPEDVQKIVHRWIMCNCDYVPKSLTLSQVASVVRREDTSTSLRR